MRKKMQLGIQSGTVSSRDRRRRRGRKEQEKTDRLRREKKGKGSSRITEGRNPRITCCRFCRNEIEFIDLWT
jgi:hypothetical protein